MLLAILLTEKQEKLFVETDDYFALITVEPRSTSLIRYQAELVLRFIRITKQFFALKLI